jgi:RES domain-containing protein
MLRVFRLCQRKHARKAFDGTGARLFGGRWNFPGIAVVYTAGSLSLAALEMFVHVDPQDAPDDLVAIPADIPDAVARREVRVANLPRTWRRTPAPGTLPRIGQRWAHELKTAVLVVPSALVPREHHYLLNPAHVDFPRIRIGRPERFTFGPRMWK